MTFLEAIKKAQPGQVIKNGSMFSDFNFVILMNGKIKTLNEYDNIDTEDMNEERWEIE